MNHRGTWTEREHELNSLHETRRSNCSHFLNRLSPDLGPFVESFYDDEAVLLPRIDTSTPQPTRRTASPREQPHQLKQRLSIQYDSQPCRTTKKSNPNSPEKLLVKYGIIHLNNKSALSPSRHQAKSSSVSMSDSFTVDTIHNNAHLHFAEENHRFKRTINVSPIRSAQPGSAIPAGTLICPLEVTRKQLNPKYNYIDLDSLERQEALLYEITQKRLQQFRERASQMKMPSLKEYRQSLIQQNSHSEKANPEKETRFEKFTEQTTLKAYEPQVTRYPKAKPKIQGLSKGRKRVLTPWRDNEEEDLSSLVQ